MSDVAEAVVAEPVANATAAPATLLTETAPAATTPPADKPVDAPKATEPVVPESYDFKLPDGVELDKGRADEFSAIAKELKLPQDQAQKVVDLAVKHEQARVEAHNALVTSWGESVKTDKELGGDKLPESLATARKAIDLGPPELKSLLESTGLGNHPAVFKWAHAVGKALSTDRFVTGGTTTNAPRDAASVLYPNLPKA